MVIFFFSFKKYFIQDIKPEAFFLIVLAGDKTNTIKSPPNLLLVAVDIQRKADGKNKYFLKSYVKIIYNFYMGGEED